MISQYLAPLITPLLTHIHPVSPSSLTKLSGQTFFAHAAATPLTQITLNLEILIDTLHSKNNLSEEADIAYQTLLQTQYLQSLIALMTRSSHSKRSRFPAKAALEELVVRCHQPLQGKYLKATLMLDKNVWLPGHAFYFQEMMSCLITNAFEAYGKYQRRKTIALVAMQRPKKLQIYLCDQGQGMSWLTHHLATHQGFTSKVAGQGLGLAFVKHAVEQHFKGKFVLSSYAEIGTIVMIQLPFKV